MAHESQRGRRRCDQLVDSIAVHVGRTEDADSPVAMNEDIGLVSVERHDEDQAIDTVAAAQ